MTISRRQFLSFVPAGLSLPYTSGKLLSAPGEDHQTQSEQPENAVTILHTREAYAGWELVLGDPREEPPTMTMREYMERYYEGDEEQFIFDWYGDEAIEVDLDVEMDEWAVLEAWCYHDSPNAKAYHLLRYMDLGADFDGPDAPGTIDFINGAHPGSDYMGVIVPDTRSMVLLQHRLDQLETNIHILVDWL